MRRIEIHLKDFVLHLESQKAIQRMFESQKREKRNENNLNPPEGFCITFRIPKGNSKKVWMPKKKRKEMRRIEIHLKDFVLHSESQKAIQKMFESQKRKEKKCEEFKSTWRILYYIQNPKRNSKKVWKTKKEKKRNEKNWNPPEGFCITFRIPKCNSKKVWKPKRKEKKWEEFKSTWRILYYIQHPKRQFKEGLKAKKEKQRNKKNLN